MRALFARGDAAGMLREIVLVAALFLCGAVASLAISAQIGTVASVWLPNAIGIVGLARARRSHWALLLLAIAAANLFANGAFGYEWPHDLLFLPPNLLEIIVGAVLLQYLRADLQFFSTVRDTTKLLALIFVVPAVGASVGTTTVAMHEVGGPLQIWLLWYAGDLIGLLGLLPLALAIDRVSLRQLQTDFRYPFLPLLFLSLLVTYIACNQLPYPFSYVAIPLLLAGLYLPVLHCLLLSLLNTLFVIGLIMLNWYQPVMLNGIFKGSLLYLPLALTIIPPLMLSVTLRIKRRESQRLAASEERWQFALECGNQGVWDLDVRRRQLYVSNAWKRVFGMSPDDVVSNLNDWNAHIHPDDVAVVQKKFDAHLRGETPTYSSEHRMLCRDGEYKWIYNRGQVMERDSNGAPLRVIGTVTDISEHKQAQLAMAQLTERFALAIDAGGVGIWEWDIAGNGLVWDARMFELHGLVPYSVTPTYDFWLSKVHPLDRDNADRLVRTAIDGGTQLDTEFRIQWPNGELHYLCAQATVIRDTVGKPVRMVGINWDVSELRRATEALHEEKERLHVTLYSIGEAVITTDEHARITFMNPVAEGLTGWPLAEVIGLAVDEVFTVIDGDTAQAIAHPATECLNNRRAFSLDENLVLVSRDGERHDIQNSAAPVRTLHGDIIGAVLVFKNVSKSRELMRKLSFNASHDPLTGLFNRAQFEIELTRALAHARAEQALHVLCFIDLDRFKIVNDTAGHAIGDTLLRELGILLRRHIRTSDILARLGGDEFGLLMFDCELEKAREILDKLIADIVALRFPWGGRVYDIGASVGVVVIDSTASATAELMSHADMACYAAKRAGGNRISVFAIEGSGDQQRESALANELRTAIANNRFVLHAQPIVPLRPVEHPSNQYELLLRMLDADGNIALPSCFMATAARFGLMAEIDRWVIREVLERQAEKISRLPHATININVAAASINDPLFLPYVLDLLERAPLDAGVLQFEISETAMMSSLSATTRFIAKLRARGCKVALDNFGSGLGAFYYLKNFRIDTIKIDGNFVRNMAHNSIDRTIVEAINKVAHQLAATTVAECVESKATLKLLRTLKLDYAQGNAIEPPRPLSDILAEKAGGAKVEPLRIIRPKI